jgi:hypothetical protein
MEQQAANPEHIELPALTVAEATERLSYALQTAIQAHQNLAGAKSLMDHASRELDFSRAILDRALVPELGGAQ